MELIIEIPDKEYEIIKKHTGPMAWADHVLKNGIPLPKGHGRLIDADYEVSTDERTVEYECGYLAPTIIEADKGEEE